MPLSVVVTSVFNGATQLFLAVLGFSMLFFWSFAMHADLSTLTFTRGIATTSGKVTRAVDTRASQGRQAVFANHYEFSVAGSTLSGVSYGPQQDQGSAVKVEYRTSKPGDSRIAGMRRDLFGPGALIVLVFPLVLGLVTFALMWMGRSQIALLRNGIVTDGVFTSSAYTSKGRFKRLEFTFASRDGHKATANRLVREEEEPPKGTIEPVLYDPDKPSRASMLKDDAFKISIDGDGRIEPRPLAAILALILPALFVAGNVFAAMRHFR